MLTPDLSFMFYECKLCSCLVWKSFKSAITLNKLYTVFEKHHGHCSVMSDPDHSDPDHWTSLDTNACKK